MFKSLMLKTCGRWVRPWFQKRFLSAWSHPRVELVYWDGRRVVAGEGSRSAVVEIGCPSVLAEMLFSPSLGFGEAYADGRLRVRGDLEAVLDAACAAGASGDAFRPGRLFRWLRKRPALLPRRRAVRNARYHYDLGNEFFRLWLDPTMTYSCAYFRSREDSLEQAQTQKLELLCRKLDLRPGQTLLDVGCGWGSLLFHAIQRYGVHGIGVTPSLEQAHYVQAEADRRGLDDRLTLHVADWRSVGGVYDRVVSVGMFEHVGKAFGRGFLRKWRSWLKPGGVSVLHTIGSLRPLPPDPWTERNIFPGGYLPTLGEIVGHASAAGLQIADVENLWQHYVMTLGHWARNFQACRDVVERMTSERFARVWWLYLKSCQSSFRTGCCQLWQVVLNSDKLSPQPLTRDPWLVPARAQRAGAVGAHR